MSEVPNPEYNPSGVADCIDTNKLPWMPLPNVPGMSIKPARASGESGIFSLIFRLEAGSSLPASVYLGSMDMLILSGKAEYIQDDVTSTLNPGTWGLYLPTLESIPLMLLKTLKFWQIFIAELHF